MNVEKKFVTFFANLQKAVNPDDISAQLYAKHMITDSEKAEIDLLSLTAQVRMNKLLAAVQRAINIDHQNYETFLDILDKERKYSALVKQMRGMVIITFIYH